MFGKLTQGHLDLLARDFLLNEHCLFRSLSERKDSYETFDACLTPCLHPNPHIETRNQPFFPPGKSRGDTRQAAL